MSNFTCPTCGLTNIDCGKAGYKTAREIDLEKNIEIAVKALEFYALKKHYKDEDVYISSIFVDSDEVDGYVENGLKAREALAKIKEMAQ